VVWEEEDLPEEAKDEEKVMPLCIKVILETSSFFIMGIPDIPNLTLEQREKLSKTISDERKDIFKLMQEKQELKMRSENPGIANKERLKLTEKISKTDEKIKLNKRNTTKSTSLYLQPNNITYLQKRNKAWSSVSHPKGDSKRIGINALQGCLTKVQLQKNHQTECFENIKI
jgi:hypothetical protein